MLLRDGLACCVGLGPAACAHQLVGAVCLLQLAGTRFLQCYLCQEAGLDPPGHLEINTGRSEQLPSLQRLLAAALLPGVQLGMLSLGYAHLDAAMLQGCGPHPHSGSLPRISCCCLRREAAACTCALH